MSEKQEAAELESEAVEAEVEQVDGREPDEAVGSEPPDEAVEAEQPAEESADDGEPRSELDILRDELVLAEAKAAENLDGWQRARAEFQNYKRRTETQMSEMRQQAASNVLSRFFPVLDDFALALGNLPAAGDGAQWADGIQLVHRKLLGILEAEGVAPIEAEPGQPFDPNYHEALTQEEHDDFDEGTIIDVVRRGYIMGERVLRPAQVRVAC